MIGVLNKKLFTDSDYRNPLGKMLLGLYALCLVFLLVIIADIMFLDNWLHSSMPRDPRKSFLYMLVFVYPHIIMTHLISLNKEFLHSLKKHSISLGLILLYSFLAITYLPERIVILLFIFTTALHTSNQQTGIGKLFRRRNTMLYSLWAISLSAQAFLALLIYARLVDISMALYAFVSLLIVSVVLLAIEFDRKDGKEANSIFLGNQVLFSMFSLLMILDYPLVAFVAIRMHHDSTAIYSYMRVWDNQEYKRGLVFLKWLKHPISLYVFAVVVTQVLLLFREASIWGAVILTFATYYHYYTESFSWKRNGAFGKYLFSK